jgi:glycoside/pentoside/hexuronide:cation symporter, GPH family
MDFPPSARTVPLGTQVAYAIGNAGLQMLGAALSFFLLIFYTDVALVPPAIAASALTIGKLWDTINDPVFGWIADRTRSRHGRRRVYLIHGALPLAVVSAALWVAPGGLSPLAAFFWIIVSYSLFDTVLSMVKMPYEALGAELVSDYDERTSFMALSSIGALAGYMLGAVGMPLIVDAGGDARTGYALAGGIFGLVAGASIAFVAWRIDEPASGAAAQLSKKFWRPLELALKNRAFIILVCAFGLVRLGFTLVMSSLAYFVIYQLQEGRDALPRILLILLAVVGASITFWRWAARKWEKNAAYAAGLLIAACGLGATFLVQPGRIDLLMPLIAIIGTGIAAHWVVPFAMLPDAADQGHAATGEQRTGMYYGLYGLVDKIARVVGTAAVGWLLFFFGYVPNAEQSTHALLGIRLVMGPIPAACILLAVPLLLIYPISRERHAAIAQAVRDRAARPAGLDD